MARIRGARAGRNPGIPPLSAPDTPLPNFAAHTQRAARPVPVGGSASYDLPPGRGGSRGGRGRAACHGRRSRRCCERPHRSAAAGPSARPTPSSRHGLLAQPLPCPGPRTAVSPRCGTTWSTTVAGVRRPSTRQRAHHGCSARYRAEPGASGHRSPAGPRSDAAGRAPASPPQSSSPRPDGAPSASTA